MGFFSKKPVEPPPPKTRITRGTELEGDLESKDSIVFEGTLDGTLTCKADVAFAQTGKIRGTLRVQTLDCAGSGEGTLFAESAARFQSTAAWRGEFGVRSLRVEKGARLEGTFKPPK